MATLPDGLLDQVRAANGEARRFLVSAEGNAALPDAAQLDGLAARLECVGALFAQAGDALAEGAVRRLPPGDLKKELLDYARNLETLQTALLALGQRIYSHRAQVQSQLTQLDSAAAFSRAYRRTY